MRQSRAIELAREYPAHGATAWLGHTAQVAMRHDWRVTEADFERAIGGQTGMGMRLSDGAGERRARFRLSPKKRPRRGQKCGSLLGQNVAMQVDWIPQKECPQSVGFDLISTPCKL